jgi:selenocysteine-specific translation elongation factor
MTHGNGNSAFAMKVDHVFYLQRIDRVMVTGTVSSGSVTAGDRLLVRGGGTDVSMTVERLEHPHRTLEKAGPGDEVGLMLHGIRKDQVQSGDIVLQQ